MTGVDQVKFDLRKVALVGIRAVGWEILSFFPAQAVSAERAAIISVRSLTWFMALSLMFFLMEKHNSHRNHYIADFEPNASAILLHLTVYCANRQSSKVRRHSPVERLLTAPTGAPRHSRT